MRIMATQKAKRRIKELYERIKAKRDAEAVTKHEQEAAKSTTLLEDFDGIEAEDAMLSYAAPIGFT